MGEDIFRGELENQFPDRNSFCYLPFRSEKEGKAALGDAGISERELNAITYGAYGSFVRKYFEERWKSFSHRRRSWKNTGCGSRRISEEKFGYFELLDLDQQRDVLQRILGEEYLTSGVGKYAEFFREYCSSRQYLRAERLSTGRSNNSIGEELEKTDRCGKATGGILPGMPQRDPEGNDRYGRGIGIGKENICGSGKGICRFPQTGQ